MNRVWHRLSREPSHYPLAYVAVLVGLMLVIQSAWSSPNSETAVLFLLGLTAAAFGLAEVLPRHRQRLAGALRVASSISAGVGIALIVLDRYFRPWEPDPIRTGVALLLSVGTGLVLVAATSLLTRLYNRLRNRD